MTTEDRPTHPPEEPGQPEAGAPDYSRRWFLTRSTAAALGLSLLEGVDIAHPSEASAEEAPDPELEARYQELLAEFTAQLDGFEQQKITPNEQEINEKLAPCTFLEQPLVIQSLDIVHKYRPFEPDPLILEKNLAAARERGDYREVPGRPSINRMNFYDAGIFFAGAFYDNKSGAVFIHELPPDDQRGYLSRYAFNEAAKSMLGVEMTALQEELDATGDRAIYEQKREAVYERFSAMYGGQLEDIPKDALVQHADAIRSAILNYRKNAAEQYALTIGALPHEAFHWFYDNGFQKEGYEGPSTRDCLVMAMKMNHERYPEMAIGENAYNTNISKLIYELTGEFRIQEGDIEAVADAIMERYDPLVIEAEGESGPDAHHRDTVYRFVNEYLARIYNGALGNTDEALAALTDQEMVKLGLERRPFKRDVQNHTPTGEELAFLKQMSYKGKPLIPQ